MYPETSQRPRVQPSLRNGGSLVPKGQHLSSLHRYRQPDRGSLELTARGRVGEVLLRGDLVDLGGVQAAQVDLVGGGDHVAGVDAAQGNTVDLEGAGNQENTLLEVLEEDHALATEAASEQDQDGTGLEGLAGSPGADGLADL